MKRETFPLLLAILPIALLAILAGVLLSRATVSEDFEDLVYGEGMVSIADASVSVEIPYTQSGFRQGLAGRDELAEDAGMLFLCLPGPYPKFWMKGMKFPIDIIWINSDLEVSGISEHVTPDSFPDTIVPRAPATHVLEVNAGFADRHGISLGDTIFGLGGSSCSQAF